jgi:hypothetical protein
MTKRLNWGDAAVIIRLLFSISIASMAVHGEDER